MSREPVLTVDSADGDTRAIALVLHGGRSKGTGPVRANQLAVLRMRPFATSLRAAGTARGLTVARLRYRVRGWNGPERSPVPDVTWALDQLSERFGPVPVALVGHSMGGRAAVYAAGHVNVHTVVGLAPWIEPGDPDAQLAGRRLLVAHGDLDRMTSRTESATFTAAASHVAASAAYVSVQTDGHAMLRRASLWHGLSTGFVLATLFDVPPSETVDGAAAKVVTEVLTGSTSVSV